MRFAAALSLLCLAACPSGGNNNNPGPSGSTGPSGETSFDSCDLDNRTGIYGYSGVTAATTVGTACTKDYNCWLGQTCQMGACATDVSNPDKLHGEVTVPEAGDYIVSVYGPADTFADASPDEINPITFEFMVSREEWPHLYRMGPRVLDVDPVSQALLSARLRTESSFRARERLSLATQGPEQLPDETSSGPGRAGMCTAEQFEHKGACYAVGQDLPALKFSFGGNANVVATVKKIVGKTAILLDKDNASVSQDEIDKLAEAFDKIAGPRDRQLFNGGADHTGALDTDSNGMVGIVLTGKAGTPGGIAGLFDNRDVDAMAMGGNGNASDLMWAQPPGVAYTPAGGSMMVTATFELVIGTLAHEYQHMINYARVKSSGKGMERLFLNEALSHLAEDLTGYGSSNLAVISSYLQNPNQSGLLVNGTAVDADTGPLRGIGYLYLRYLFEKSQGYKVSKADGKLSDAGGIAFIEKLMTGSANGVDRLSFAGGTFFRRFATFFPALAAAGNPQAPLVAEDCRFNYAEPKTDPLTGQTTGLKLKDPSRKDATGASSLLNGYQEVCTKDDAEGGQCRMFMTGGVSFLWQAAKANDTIRVKGDSGFNLRIVAVKVK